MNVQSTRPSLTKVAVQRGEREVTVVVEGTYPMAYKVIPIDAFRLSWDLDNVGTNLSFRELPVDHMLLSRIRIGQHPKKLRLVLDLNLALNKDLKYAVTARGNQLALRLVKV